MNVAVHLEKENRNKGKREAGENEKKQTNDIRKTECCAFAVVQRATRQKHGCVRRVPGVTGTLEKASSHFNPTQTVSGTAPSR